MDSQRSRRVGDAFLVARIRFLNIKLLEFFQRFIKHDVPVEHVFNHCFQAGAYLHRFVSQSVCVRSPSVSEGHVKYFLVTDSASRPP